MGSSKENKLSLKDMLIVGLFVVLAILHIVLHVFSNGFTSLGAIFEQIILILLAYVGVLDIFYYTGWHIFVPDFMLEGKKKERIEEIHNCLDDYFHKEVKYLKNSSEERIHYIMSQLGVTAAQFEHLRVELVKMRCQPLSTIADAKAKMERYIQLGEPFVVDLSKRDSARVTYNKVTYYLNFGNAMFIEDSSRELTAMLSLLITERIGLDAFDKIIIPYDSNFMLGVEVGKKLAKPVVHIREKKGRIEETECWDGNLNPKDRVLIVHDVLVTSDQIIHALNKIPDTCQVVGLACLVSRKEWNGLEKLTVDRNLRVEHICDLDDKDISKLIKH